MRLVILLLFFAALTATAADNWDILKNCTLVDSDYMDGDSFHVECNGQNYHFRLYFVDCPETDDRFPDRIRDQSAYFGISPEQNKEIGLKAKEFTMRILNRQFTVLTRWYDARGASAQKRFYAVVLCDGKNLAEELVSEGFARAYGMRANFPDGPRSKDFVSGLKRLEDRAMRSSLGGWSKPNTGQQIATSEPPSLPIEVTAQSTNSVSPQCQIAGTPDELEIHTEFFLKSFTAMRGDSIHVSDPSKPIVSAEAVVPASDSLLNINTATRIELEELPGVGPALAERIIANRPYSQVEAIKTVKGIGDRTFETIVPLIKTK